MRAWIGTSGYSYADWVGPFYPAGTKSAGMLNYYIHHFPLVELNFTFYRLPTPAMLARIANQTPDGFQFIVKMYRSLSHDEKPDDLMAFRQATEELRKRNRLMGVLCQLPQAIHNEKPHRAWLEKLSREFREQGLAIEFRHRSWNEPDTPAWLHELGADLVAVDVPHLHGLYPRGLVASSTHLYVRFHSRAESKWYLGDKDRYDYDYSDSELREWVEALSKRAAQSERVLLLFNNCHRGQAAANAKRMGELLREVGPQLEVVGPLALTRQADHQLRLFE